MSNAIQRKLIRGFDKSVVAGWVALASWLRPRSAVARPLFAWVAPAGRSVAGLRLPAGEARSARGLSKLPPAAPEPGGTWVAIKLVGMGDAVLMLPSLAALRAAGRRVVVITTRRCAELFTASGCADEVVVLGAPGGLRQAWRHLRGCGGVLDFEQHVFWSAALAQGAPARARRFGFRTISRLRNRAYDQMIEPGAQPRHMKEIFDDLARATGAAPAAALRPLRHDPAAEAVVAAWLDQRQLTAGPLLVVAPGSGASVPFRRLSAATWIEVFRRLPADLPVVLTGSIAEAALITEIAALAQRRLEPEGRRLEVAPPMNLAQLAVLLRRAAVVAAIDSGPMHLAAAMNAAVVGIFGPDTPRRYAPYNPRSVSVTLHLPCSPCNNCWIYREPRCTNPEAYACLQRLAPEQVAAAITSVLGTPRRAAAEGADDEREHDRAEDGHQDGVDDAAAGCRAESAHNKAPDDGPDDTNDDIHERAKAAAVHDLAGGPPGDQADDNPPQQHHHIDPLG